MNEIYNIDFYGRFGAFNKIIQQVESSGISEVVKNLNFTVGNSDVGNNSIFKRFPAK